VTETVPPPDATACSAWVDHSRFPSAAEVVDVVDVVAAGRLVVVVTRGTVVAVGAPAVGPGGTVSIIAVVEVVESGAVELVRSEAEVVVVVDDAPVGLGLAFGSAQ